MLFCLCAACTRGSSGDKLRRQVTLSRCHLSAPGSASRIPARCGLVRVPQNWDEPDGRKLRLHVALVEPDGQEPTDDPVVFLAGGPGQAASESYPTMAAGFARLRRQRTVMLMDQRGTGKSLPLRCVHPPGSESDPFRPLPAAEEASIVRKCVKSLNKIADLERFTTRAAVRDLDHVRKMLGFRTLNLYGISYGTRVALSYLRAHPERVRTVILDGVVPQDEALGPRVMTEGPARVKRLLVKRCADTPACVKRFGDLGAAFAAVEARLEQPVDAKIPASDAEAERATPGAVRQTPSGEPVDGSATADRSPGPRRGVRVTLRHPRTGKKMSFAFDWEAWTHTLRFAGYATESLSVLPLLVHTAHATGDYAPLAAQALVVADTLERAIASGLEASVLCSEDLPFAAADIKKAKKTACYGRRALDSMARLCALWPHKPAPAAFKKPVVSHRPVLLLSGEVDPVTPPQNAAHVAKTLANSRHLVAAGQGHGVITRGCVPTLVEAFVRTADPKAVNAECLHTLRPAPLFLDFAGPGSAP